jgi:putative FmdB family regulatory protein
VVRTALTPAISWNESGLMPLYEYECEAGHRFELIRKFSDPPLETCPTCGALVHKLISSPAFQFKGTGWYITDYAKKDGAASASGDSKSDASAKDDNKNEKADKAAEKSEKAAKTDKAEKADKTESKTETKTASDSTPAASSPPKSTA